MSEQAVSEWVALDRHTGFGCIGSRQESNWVSFAKCSKSHLICLLIGKTGACTSQATS